MKNNSFFSESAEKYSPVVLGDIVNIIDSDNVVATVLYQYKPVSVAEIIARHIDKSVQSLLRMRELSMLPDSAKLASYPAITNYMVGVLDVLIFLGFIEDFEAAKIMKYLNTEFLQYLTEGKYYSASPE